MTDKCQCKIAVKGTTGKEQALVSEPLARNKVVVGCSDFKPWQHPRYEEGYKLVTVRTHVNFIVLPHRKTRPSAP